MIFLALGLVAAMADTDPALNPVYHEPAAQYCLAEVDVNPKSYVSDVRPDENPAAEASDQYNWALSLSYGISDFSPNRGHWSDYSFTLRHYWENASLALEYLSAERFDNNADAVALDAYVDLWRRAYTNLRYQYSLDPDHYPDYSYRMEIFQGVGKGWELAGSYDHLNFDGNSVDMYGAGLGKYKGNWYLRWRTLFVPSTARLGISHRALARYYYAGNGDDYMEINGGFSRGGEFIRGTRIVETTKSQSIGAAIQKYFHPRWGIKLSGGYDDDKDSFVERSISLGIFTRWL